MIDAVRTVRDGVESIILAYLGSGYKKLSYVEDVEKNNFLNNHNRYGVRALAGGQVPGVNKAVHVTQAFEIVLSKSYNDSSISDTEQLESALDNFNNMLSIYKDLANTRVGVPLTILNVTNLQMSEPEYLVDSKVAIQRATMDITYRFSLI